MTVLGLGDGVVSMRFSWWNRVYAVTAAFGGEPRDAADLVRLYGVALALDERDAIEHVPEDVVLDDGVVAAQADAGWFVGNVGARSLNNETADGYSIRGDDYHVSGAPTAYDWPPLPNDGHGFVDYELLAVGPGRYDYRVARRCGRDE